MTFLGRTTPFKDSTYNMAGHMMRRYFSWFARRLTLPLVVFTSQPGSTNRAVVSATPISLNTTSPMRRFSSARTRASSPPTSATTVNSSLPVCLLKIPSATQRPAFTAV